MLKVDTYLLDVVLVDFCMDSILFFPTHFFYREQ